MIEVEITGINEIEDGRVEEAGIGGITGRIKDQEATIVETTLMIVIITAETETEVMTGGAGSEGTRMQSDYNVRG